MQLLERHAELIAAAAQWRRARSGAGSFVLVSGEAGIGKTTLVRTFVDGLDGDAAVAWGVCDPLRTPRPLGPLHDAAAELGGRVSEVLSAATFPHEVFSSVLDALASRPSVLVVDDLQWADEATLDLLRFLLRRIGGARALVVGTYRDDEIGAGHRLRGLLGDAARTADAARLPLQPLSVAAVAAIADGRHVEPARVHALTGGNPFFVEAMLAHDGDDLPATVRDAVLARTSDLDEDALELLDLLACAPEALSDRTLAALDVRMRSLRALSATGLLERGRRGLVFRHELYRRAVECAIPPGGKAALHARMLDALEASGATEPALLAHHAVAARDDVRALRHASLAGMEAARSGAHTEAAEFFATALEHVPPSASAQRAELLELRAAELYLLDRLADAIALCERAIALRRSLDDRPGVCADHQALSVYEWYNANRAVAERHAASAVEVLDADVELPQLGHAYAMEAYLAMQNSDVARARSFHERARQIAAHAGDRRLDARVETIDSVLAMMGGDLRGRERILSLIERDAEYFDDVHSSAYSNVAYMDVEQRRFQSAEEVLAISLPAHPRA